VEPRPSPLLCLVELENREAVSVAGVVGRAEPLVMLPSILIAEPSDPSAAFGAPPIADCASRRQHRPIGLAPFGKLGPGGAITPSTDKPFLSGSEHAAGPEDFIASRYLGSGIGEAAAARLNLGATGASARLI